MSQITLSQLFSPLSKQQFLKHFKENEPIHIKNAALAAPAPFGLPFLKSLEQLLAIWPDSVNAYLPGIADEVNSTKVAPKEALLLYEQGSGLYFDDIHYLSPQLQNWLLDLKNELSFSNLTVARCLAYAISKGQGTAAHFDQNTNFVFQLEGSKKWKIAKNSSVTQPLSRHTMGTPADPELATYLTEELPETMPQNSTEFLLEAGDLLFLPRGAWHETEALSHSFSLNFTYTAPSYADLLLASLRHKLIQSESLRESASITNLSALESSMDKLKQEVQSLSLEDLLKMTEQNQIS